MPSDPAAGLGRRRFLIVTPVFNAEAFIDEAVASVLRQGITGFSLHYHVQDGGSTDGTLDRLRTWERRLHEGLHFPHAADIVFSFASERDGGMYDALQRGFTRLAPRDDDILTWINSDDGLAQGSLVAVGGVFEDVAGCEFLSGRTALLNEAGAVIVLAPALPFARDALADGRHDGRAMPFLMQEGTFFSGRVWNAVGGVDPSFRLAGDWDLWRRMARVAGHCVVDSVTGYHRRRQGQLSADMDAYHREIDTAPPLPDAAALGSLGTIVTFDQATARWISTAYDPSTPAAPTLLRDGRAERSAICRPVAGFAAPEGPYPQYQLPGDIRWIDGNRAEISMLVPTTGRYRLRLTLRASHDGIVVGLGIGTRAPQPITLEAPLPLVDQVIETVRWLDAGENRLVIDCNGPADARSVLLIRCEATSTDEAFLRLPVLPPADGGRADRPALAIAILCDDDEPDLLELSLAACEAVAPAGTAVFVVRDPENAALDRVIRSRRNPVTGCIDKTSTQTEAEPLRQMLHAAGHAEVLVVPRGALVVPRGIYAASALLDVTGAAGVAGLIDERDSMGRSLHLSDSGEAVLYRAGAGTDAMLRAGCALAQSVSTTSEICDPPVVWVLDGDRPTLGRTPAALLAGALALLGYDVRHVVVASGMVPALPPGGLIIASHGLAAPSTATMAITSNGGKLSLTRHGGWTVELPFVVDTDLLLPRGRDEARQRLGFAPDEWIVCITEASAAAAAAAIARAAATAGGVIRILNFGHEAPSVPPGCTILSLGTVADALLLSYLLSAADAAIVAEPDGSPLAGPAWTCGLTVLDPNGQVLRPEDVLRDSATATIHPADTAADAGRSRDLMLTTRSLAALAAALDERCPDLGGVGGSSPLRLRGGTVRVRSYRDASQPGWFDRIASADAVTVFDDGAWLVAADGERGLSIGGCSAELVVSLGRAGVSGLRLHVRGTPGDTWTAHAGGGATTFRLGEDGDATASVIGTYDVGPTRIRFERQGDDEAFAPPLHVIGLSAIGAPVPRMPSWEETKIELVPANAWPIPKLEIDGDWQRLAGFLPEEPPVPQEGLYAPFRWSGGDNCTIRVRTAMGGPRALCLALSAGVHRQCVRPVIAGRTYDWCTPLAGPIGHVERREWLVDWPAGDVDVTLELSDVLRAPGQELGIILFAVALSGS